MFRLWVYENKESCAQSDFSQITNSCKALHASIHCLLTFYFEKYKAFRKFGRLVHEHSYYTFQLDLPRVNTLQYLCYFFLSISMCLSSYTYVYILLFQMIRVIVDIMTLWLFTLNTLKFRVRIRDAYTKSQYCSLSQEI